MKDKESTDVVAEKSVTKRPIVRSQWTVKPKVQLFSSGESLTQQHFKDEVNVNNIIAKYLSTGEIMVNTTKPQFGFASDVSFTESMYNVAQAREQYENLSASMREKYPTIEAYWDHTQADQPEREPEDKADEGAATSAPSEVSPEPETAPSS